MDDAGGCIIAIIVIGIVIAIIVYVLGALYATLLFLGINIFILLDSLLFIKSNIQPLVIWPITGLIIGISIGLVIAGIKNKIKYLIPVGIAIPIVLIVLLSVARPSKSVQEMAQQQDKFNTITEKSLYKLGTVISNVGATLRSGPSKNYSSLGSLKYGESVTVLGEESGWYKVQFVRSGQNNIGYIYNSLLNLNDEYAFSGSSKSKTIPEKSTSITEEIEEVSIAIESVPKGASVYISGQEKGKTPLSIKVNSGYNTFLLKYPGYKDYNEKILISSGGKSNFNFKLNLKYDLVGTWSGIFSDKTMTMVIESFDSSTVKGYDKVKWTDSSEPQNVPFRGTFDLISGSIELEEQGESFGIGKFVGKISSDGNSMSGTWTRSKGPAQTFSWSVRK